MTRKLTGSFALAAFGAMLVFGGAPSAQAAGCLKGAAVGGVAGHFVGSGHAVAGAAIGCAVGHHRASVKAREAARARQVQTNDNRGDTPTDSRSRSNDTNNRP